MHDVVLVLQLYWFEIVRIDTLLYPCIHNCWIDVVAGFITATLSALSYYELTNSLAFGTINRLTAVSQASPWVTINWHNTLKERAPALLHY